MRNAWLPRDQGTKRRFCFQPVAHHRTRHTFEIRPLVAIALPSVTGGLVRASPFAPRDAFMALVWQSRTWRRFPLEATLQTAVALTRTIPFTVSMGPDPLAVAEGLDRLHPRSLVMMAPLITVVIPCHNGERYLQETLEASFIRLGVPSM